MLKFLCEVPYPRDLAYAGAYLRTELGVVDSFEQLERPLDVLGAAIDHRVDTPEVLDRIAPNVSASSPHSARAASW
ncbi:hypothetical protein OM076_41090 [Solirubrobacter ginsenosidimutans]|uniref:Uncharacterized protein n=1 Tax=Solirubrobacter ginsenosidimutans TaxID=490573 RepID=A0A9X3N487_9ACTN|nr:hypothetical protein [Solirubrobacter ginsenosidimutans]